MTHEPSRFRRLLRSRFAYFLQAGAVGFAVDVGLTTGLISLTGWGHGPGRLTGFLGAITATWLINRHRAFGDRSSTTRVAREGLRYGLVQSGGALINLGTYFGLVSLLPLAGRLPVLPIAVASAAALGWNYLLCHRWVFGPDNV